jgi:branched-chain amino acid transport system permease protein
MAGRLKANGVLTLSAVAVLMLGAMWAEANLSQYYVKILHFWGIYAILGVTYQLVYGYTGQFSLAHAALAAVGAYTTALLTLSPETKALSFLLTPPIWPISVVEWPLLPALLLAGLLAGVVGFIVGAPALRLRGDYLAIVTMGMSEIIRLLFCNLPSVCNGAMGLKGIPMGTTLPLTWAVVATTLFVIKRLVDGNYGRALKGIREDEIGAEGLGVNLFYHKLLAFVVSSFFVGIAGGLMAQILGTIDPATFGQVLSYGALTIVVLGGVRSLTGTVLAAGVYTISSELLRAVEAPITVFGVHLPGVPGMRVIFFGLLLLMTILYYRKGFLGEREFSWEALASLLGRFRTSVGKAEEES